MMTAPILRLSPPALAGAVALLLAGACGGDVQGPPDDRPDALSGEFLSTLIVSNPVKPASTPGASLILGGFASSDAIVFVSLPPGSVSNGETAVIQTRGAEAQTTAAMVDGGFDPVPLAAGTGDTLDVRIELAGGGASLEFYTVVPPSIPPVIVRTDPPPKKRDVPLNAVMLIVFSEPIDAATVTASSLQLRLGDVPVAGTLEFGDGANLMLTFTPAEPLVPGAEYTILITRDIADLDGDALAEELRVEFGTEVDSGTATALRIGAYLSDRGQSIGVFRAGEIVNNAVVTLNGSALAQGTPGCTAGECTAYHWGDLRLSAGSPVVLEVTAGGVTVEATGSLPETPILTAPPGATTFALADSIAVTWTSATDPDGFWVGSSNDVWCCDLLALPPGTAREWKIAASDIGVTTSGQVAIHVYALNAGSFTGPADPESYMDIWSNSAEAQITITP